MHQFYEKFKVFMYYRFMTRNNYKSPRSVKRKHCPLSNIQLDQCHILNSSKTTSWWRLSKITLNIQTWVLISALNTKHFLIWRQKKCILVLAITRFLYHKKNKNCTINKLKNVKNFEFQYTLNSWPNHKVWSG